MEVGADGLRDNAMRKTRSFRGDKVASNTERLHEPRPEPPCTNDLTAILTLSIANDLRVRGARSARDRCPPHAIARGQILCRN